MKSWKAYRTFALWYVCWIIFASLLMLILGDVGGFIVFLICMFSASFGVLFWLGFTAATGIGVGIVSSTVPGFEWIIYVFPN